MAPKLDKAEALLKMLNDGLSKQEFVSAFENVVKRVKAFEERIEKEYGDLKSTLPSIRQAVRIELGSLHTLKNDILSLIENVRDGKDGAKGEDGEDGPPGPPGKDGRNGRDGSPDTASQVRDKLESLKGEARLDKGAIKGLDEAIQSAGGTRVGWGAHPLTVQALGVTVGKNVRFINFKGNALDSVSMTKSGVVEVVYNSGSSLGTPVSEEVPTDSGDHTNFTIAHTPIAGTFKLYRGGARQQSVGVTPDYTLTGTALVLVTPLATGEVLFCDYNYA